MEAVIIAGGKGTRLGSMTKEIPKPMIPVMGKPILEHQIEEFRDNGVTDIIITVGYLRDVIRDYFGDGRKFGVRIRYVEEDTPLGSAGAFYFVKDLLTGSAFVVYGDVLFSLDMGRMLAWHRKQGALATLFAHPNSHPYDSDIVLHDDKYHVTGFLRKKEDRSGIFYHNCVNAGFFVVEKEAMDFFQQPQKLDLEKDFLRFLAENQQLSVYISTEYIKDMGTFDRLDAVEGNMKSGMVGQRNLKHPQKCIFLDRDGTLNVWRGLISHVDQMKLETRAAEAVRMINESGYLAIVVTNQPVIARGMCTVDELERINMELEIQLGMQGAYIDALYYCPHHPDKGYEGERPEYKIPCECRKPGIALIERAAMDYNIVLEDSWFIGDSTRDVKAGKNAGMRTVLLKTGEGGMDGKYDVVPDKVCDDLITAVRYVLEQR